MNNLPPLPRLPCFPSPYIDLGKIEQIELFSLEPINPEFLTKYSDGEKFRVIFDCDCDRDGDRTYYLIVNRIMPNTIYDQQLKQYEIDKAEYDRIEKLHKEAAEISHKQKLEQKEREEFERLRKKFERK
jgi:hypothetical protein